MKRNLSCTDLEQRTHSVVAHMVGNMEHNSTVFLDTGAIIDFEREVRRWKLKDSTASPDKFYRLLNFRAFPIYVTDGVFDEVKNHNLYHRYNGGKEISDATMKFISQMHVNFGSGVRNLMRANSEDYDKIAYDVHWASKMAFDVGHKKNCLDSMSVTDREIVSVATYVANNPDLFSSNVVIVSPDCHIRETVKVLEGKSLVSAENYGTPGYSHKGPKVVGSLPGYKR